MRLLRINDIDVEIDDKTAIGIDFQSYDIKQPGKNFITVSNTFTVPLTANNKAIFGNASNPQSLSTVIYEKSICNYWVDNEQFIVNAKCRVEQIQERISIFIFQKNDIWDDLKEVTWTDFLGDFLIWMQAYKSLPSATSPYIGTTSDFLSTYINNTEGIVLPMYMSNTYAASGFDDYQSLYIRGAGANGGHFCIYAKTIFEYIEYAFDVDFLTSGGVLTGNIWDDAIAPKIYIPARELTIRRMADTLPNYKLYFEPAIIIQELFAPLKDQRDKKDKTLYDFVNSFMLHFNILKDEFEVNGDYIIRMSRFDDLETLAEVEDWSGNLSGIPLFKSSIEGFTQTNLIKFKSIYPEGDSLLNSKTLNSLNLNLDYSTDLFEIDAYIPSFIDITGGVVPDLSTKESFKTFSFLLNDGLTDDFIDITIVESTNIFTTDSLKVQKAALYSLDSEYNFLDDIITYPKYYEIEKWFKKSELKDFEFFKQYYIRELNGSFFINKISGYNPDKSKEPTTIEIVRISDKTPLVDADLNYWTDGVSDAFTDSDNDYFF